MAGADKNREDGDPGPVVCGTLGDCRTAARPPHPARRRVPVLLPYPFPGPFDYRVPPDLDPQPGDVVLVPLNRREEVGVVWDAPPDDAVPDRKLKPLNGMIDTPPMRAELRKFIDWMAAYTLSPPGEVMAMALRILRSARRSRPWAGAAPTRCRTRS